MKNLLKRLGVMIASLMLVMTTFAMPSFGAEDNTTVTIKNTGSGVNVTLYKIIKQDSNGNWINMYKKTVGGEQVDAIADPTKPTSAEILALAQRSDLTNKIQLAATDYNSTEDKWTKDLAGAKPGTENNKGAGMYLVLVENADSNLSGTKLVKVFNPMIVSIYPDNTTGKLASGTANAGGEFDAGAENNVAYAKSSEPGVDKYIVRNANDTDNDKANFANANKTAQDLAGTTNVGNANTSNENKYGDTASRGVDPKEPKKGDKIWYEIPTTIPAYSNIYFYTKDGKDIYPTFKVYDTLSTGLYLNAKGENNALNADELKVYVKNDAGTYVELPKANNWTIDFDKKEGEDTYSFVIQFTRTYLQSRIGKQTDVVVKYSATIGENCDENFDPETNTAKIKYSHKPGDQEGRQSEEITTYHYTFSINGKINGANSQDLREVVKVGCSEDGSFVFKETEKAGNKWTEDIQGAVFKLYKANTSKATDAKPYDNWEKADNNAIRTATSDKDGRLMGLDRLDAGDYVLIEDSVPAPYAKKNDVIPVRITATLKDNGQLESYKIVVGGVVAGNYKATYTNNNITKIEALADDDNTVIKAYQNPNASSITDAQAIEKYTIVAKREGESDADYAARVAAYKATFNDVHPEAADIRNTKTGQLPSTGGMGTILFTIGGIVLIGLAFLLLFGGKRRKTQNN